MRGSDRIGERHGELDETRGRHAIGWNHRAQRLAIDELHRQEMGAGALLDGVDGDDARVAERGTGHIEAQIGVRDGLFSRYRILIPPDRRRRPAGSVTEVSLVTNGRAVRMPSAVGS